MSFKSLNDPFNPNKSLMHQSNCDCPICQTQKQSPQLNDRDKQEAIEKQVDASFRSDASTASAAVEPEATGLNSPEDMIDRAVESAVVREVFGHNDFSRRSFLSMIGAGTAAAALGSVFPMEEAKAAMKETMGLGQLEKKKLNIGFVPITCATPIIMAHPMGFYERYGLDVDVIKTAGWAVARDKSLAGEYDASHMLTPMPLAMSMGAGSTSKPFLMPTVENTNGQAIVLHNDHKDKRDPKQWKGFKFGVPFEYSMHNFLLRYYVAEFGLDPDKDIQIRVVPPPEMVANLRAGNLDGYLSPDPFNQRAVWEKVGFIHTLTKDIWEGHPCCAFACSKEFAVNNPNTYGALLRSIIDATEYSAKQENRSEIAEAISPKNYLNQPVPVVNQVLTGRYADGLGSVMDVPDRIDFDPFPWHSMGVWILTQMKRWGYVKGDIDYKKIAEEVYLATETGQVMKELGYEAPSKTYENYTIMGKEFDYNKPEAYIDSFKIRR
ncbi:MAG: CmpA/NrtA family ABC transporter substrate-binding protein [Hydrogenovibrio sp.]|uniref:CmpA/NrtA family ABC transporter substrate-binding protein n=1 Tax=Hydrogenovibrio sp. TaxID=2065821 RepID=UPI00287053A0|nr:CmpA/NrtA family ABC transporter substrate-binding protein [Hydrogenovibrio sp.]MDR9498817.1 CmpA/NrtA family ABC transporter substrate-binding protein [Hydrogenovibrio sp.]